MNELDRLESLLHDTPPPALPDRARFVDRVMRRVRVLPAWQPAAPVPWWAQAAADPAAVLACALMALFLWRPEAMHTVSRVFSGGGLFDTPLLLQIRSSLALERPLAALVLRFLGVSLLVWASVHLYRWSERLTRRAASP
ncbi:MAG TPA: hypothetical protein VFD83_02855 [Candidatus Polarisedimenticolia bacterium]|nr:hypothetical protein [Candidatus Polarisedimenticolia bacterium]